jgi:uncharacterized protein YigE (DUF2233 family)
MNKQVQNNGYISYIANPQMQHIQLYWKNYSGVRYGSIQHLKRELKAKHQQLVFAMNGGMYKPDFLPVGLFIHQGNVVTLIDTGKGNGNFYLSPNGIFYITQNNEAGVCATIAFKTLQNILYATQSGPMLLINGNVHSAFTKNSHNINIRNGVGILPNGNVLFALSRQPVNLYDFASWFKQQGCKNALYLDGFVSRMYAPEKKWVQLDGDFGLIIGITKK